MICLLLLKSVLSEDRDSYKSTKYTQIFSLTEKAGDNSDNTEKIVTISYSGSVHEEVYPTRTPTPDIVIDQSIETDIYFKHYFVIGVGIFIVIVIGTCYTDSKSYDAQNDSRNAKGLKKERTELRHRRPDSPECSCY